MARKTQISPTLQILLGGASFVIIVIGLQAAASIVNSFFLALIITITVTPLLRWLIGKGVPKWLALSKETRFLAAILGANKAQSRK